jgi:DNA-binding PadR family transcriptional regulator
VTMRQTHLRSAILTALLSRADAGPKLWRRVSQVRRTAIHLRTFSTAIDHLREQGLIDASTRSVDTDAAGRVHLTRRGRVHAELLALRRLIPPSRQREAARRIHRIQALIDAVVAG